MGPDSLLGVSPVQYALYDSSYRDMESIPSFKSFSSVDTVIVEDQHDRLSMFSDRNIYGNVSMATSGPCGAVAMEDLRETVEQKLSDPYCLPEEFMVSIWYGSYILKCV